MPVQIFNDTALALGFAAGRLRHPDHHLTVMVKGAFSLANGEVTVAERPLFGGDEPWDEDAPSSPRYASDFAPFKPKADVTVVGTYYVPSARPQGTGRVALRLGPIKKTLLVFGDRQFVTHSFGRHDISEPAPFRSLPMRWEFAFGGPGFSANPLGKGFGAAATAAERALPNIELPSAPMRAPADRPAPAGFGPIDRRWSQRIDRLGTYDRRWLDDRWPDFPHDFDPAYFNAAPLDQQVPYLGGDEPFSIEGMLPDGARLDAKLPGIRPRSFVRRVRAGALVTEEVRLNLDTIAIDVDASSLVLLWRGLVPVATRDYAEIERALLVTESLAEVAHPAERYLAPSFWAPTTPTPSELGALEDQSARGAPVDMPARSAAPKEPDPAEVAALDQERADLAAAGVDTAILERLKGVTSAAVFSAILIANFPKPESEPAEQATPEAAKSSAHEGAGEDEAEKARLKKELDAERADLRTAGVDPALLTKLEAETTRHGFLGTLLAGLPPPATKEEELERRELSNALAKQADEEKAAALANDAKPRAARGERLTRDEAIAIALRGGSLAGANLAELDLSGAELRGVNLSSANLTRASLRGTNLAGADLTRATLRLADLSGASLVDAVAEDANLEATTLATADLTRANIARATLTGAKLERSKLDGADLTGAKLSGASLREASLCSALLYDADLDAADLTRAVGTKASFRNALLRGAKLDEAKLDGALFIEAELSKATFAGASLREAHFEHARGVETSFRGADLTNARAEGARFVGGQFAKISAEKANWSGAELTGADFEGAMLVAANFTGASLATASFHRARLEEAHLSKAKLGAAKLTQANLFRARLGGADLTAADCRGSNLFECDLFEATTTNARFERANLKRTRLADRSAE